MITLEQAKVHLRIDHDDEDGYIESLIAAAQEYVEDILTPTQDPESEDPPVPPAVTEKQRQVVRLLVGHWYTNRESVSEKSLSEVPMAVRALLLLERPAGGLF